MARRLRRTLLALAALGCLSWGGSPRPPVVAAPAPVVAPAAAAPDSHVEAVRARLARYETGLARHEEEALAHTVVQEARRAELPVELVLAVMHVESRYHTFAVSPVGAVGLMQLLPSTAEDLAAEHQIPWRGARTLFDPHANVRLGVAYLKWLERRYDGRLDVALAAYNWGPGRIDRRLRAGRPLPVQYARDVLAIYGARRSS
jgi:soluble lytic murein transglycosylase